MACSRTGPSGSSRKDRFCYILIKYRTQQLLRPYRKPAKSLGLECTDGSHMVFTDRDADDQDRMSLRCRNDGGHHEEDGCRRCQDRFLKESDNKAIGME